MKKINRYGACLSLAILVSCSDLTKEQDHLNLKPYFDLKGYFKKEILTLNQRNSIIKKTVYSNQSRESKNIQMTDWENEFDLFSSSDINKPDWTDSYAIDSTAAITTYSAKDPKLKTKKISIYFDHRHAIQRIAIHNAVKNWLYESSETLNYFPDSAYAIEKEQRVRFIGANSYRIIALFR